MPALPTDLRNRLERVVVSARDAAEAGARAALDALAVHKPKFYPHMSKQQQELRNHLRARARQLGDRQDASGRLAIDHLAGECAYEHWHRMLFARFLAENNLLIEPQQNMAISLAEAEELAKVEAASSRLGNQRQDAAATDVWVYASRCAQDMLPQIFRPDDPLLQITFATEHMLKLEKLLASLPATVFTASDALGWVYQFWQSKKKDEVNRSEVKIGADELPAVTQLFTEPYMVEFLLHNTLGAWWAGKRLSDEATKRQSDEVKSEDELRKLVALPGVSWDYLRFVRDPSPSKGEGKGEGECPWRPAGGTFDGWPKAAKDIKVLDPCCGSGHFLVAALHHLVPIRMAEEGLSAGDAVDAVLRDNLHGLEIDERCCQIAAFALAFAAWTYTPSPSQGEGRGEGASPSPSQGEGRGEGRPLGYRPLPELHIACTGIGPQCSAEKWIELAEQSGIPMPTVGREAIKNGLLNLHRLFSQAPTLGSLINPAELPADLIAADYETIQPYLTAIRAVEKADDETRERAIAAAGMVKAADLLAGEYTLVITNVPYLTRAKQNTLLHQFADSNYSAARADLATVFVDRMFGFVQRSGTLSIVTPQNWVFLNRYKDLRCRLLRNATWNALARLGPGAFETISGEVVNVGLFAFTQAALASGHNVTMIDALPGTSAKSKAELLAQAEPLLQAQEALLKNPDSRLIFGIIPKGKALEEYADCLQGIVTGDDGQLKRVLWEFARISEPWIGIQGTVPETTAFGGRESLVLWEDDGASVARPQGLKGWARLGVCVNRMSGMCACRYSGDAFDINVAAITPYKAEHVPAIWSFCASPEFRAVVRKLDQKLNVTNATIGKVPFDLTHWQEVADRDYPDGLPEPECDDPTQWLFHGWPCGCGVPPLSFSASDTVQQDKRQDAASTRGSGVPPLSSGSAGRPALSEALSDDETNKRQDAEEDHQKRQDAASTFYDAKAPTEFLTGNLPHWRQEGVTYFVTWRTGDSLPQEKLDQWKRERVEWLARNGGAPKTHEQAREYARLFSDRIEDWLDAGYGACVLRQAELRGIVEAALKHFERKRYVLDDFVIASNHVHLLVTPLEGYELSEIMHSWRSFTAKEINKALGRTGEFWQKESFDHIVRSPAHFEKFREYIHGHVEAASSRLPPGAADQQKRRDAEGDQRKRRDAASTTTLQVAVARLLGYRWPAELDDKMRLSKRGRELVAKCGELAKFADNDGIVCIPAVRGEDPAAERLLKLLDACGGSGILPLQSAAGSRSHLDLDDWLRNGFFEEHCKLFHDRPFVWHIWDGRKRDGFHALVNYHKLCGEATERRSDGATKGGHAGRRLLESLTYAYLGEWITRQKDGVKRGEGGAEDRLAAALELQKRLEAILAGEPPFDIFVRWKPLADQPIGWEPDINDGVRMNIRPFLASDLPGGRTGAGILRYKPNIKWTKDRGKEPQRPKADFPWFWGWDEKTEDFAGGKEFDGNRWNACHYTNKAKQAARDAAADNGPERKRVGTS